MSDRGRWSSDVLECLKNTDVRNSTELEYLLDYQKLHLMYVHALGDRRKKQIQIEMNKNNGDIVAIYQKELSSIEIKIKTFKDELAILEASKPIQDILNRQEPQDIIMSFYKAHTPVVSEVHQRNEVIEKIENEEDKPLKFWKIPIALIVLFSISIFDLPYGFYTFLRISVCLLSLFFAFIYYGYKEKISLLSATAIAIAILWNPVLPIYLDKETWVGLDVMAISIEVIMLIFSYKIWKKS